MAEEEQKSETEEQTKVEQNAETQDSSIDTDEKTETSEETKAEEKELTPEEKIQALEKEIAELKNQALYKAAENDNWRKRMMQQKEEAVTYANASLLGDLLESLDNFDRTVDAASTATDVKSIADGIKMINGSLVKMLEDKYGLSAYGVEGDEFNPDIHEAIGRVEEDVEKETLKQVYLKGYKLNDRPIRLAKVMVSVPKV